MSIKFAIRLNKKKRIPRINVLRSVSNTSSRGTEVKKYDTLGTIQQFDADNIEAFAKEKNIDGLDKMELEEGICQLAFNKEELNSSLENLERKTLYFSADFNQSMYKLWELGKKYNIPFCPADIMQRALLDEAIEMECHLNEISDQQIEILKSMGIDTGLLGDEWPIEKPLVGRDQPLLDVMRVINPNFVDNCWFGSLESDVDDSEDDEIFERQKKQASEKNNAYIQYRKRITTMTVKGKCDFLLSNQHYQNIESSLKSGDLANVGQSILALRDNLLKDKKLSREFKESEFTISKPIAFASQEGDDGLFMLLKMLSDCFGCYQTCITSGKKEPMVLSGNREHVKIAFDVCQPVYHYLKEAFKKFVDQCHKNTKRKNRYIKAGSDCEDLVCDMFRGDVFDYEEHKLFDGEQEKKLSSHAFRSVRCYY